MQKIVLVALLVVGTLCSSEYCNFFKGFGSSFAGDGCSVDLDNTCLASFDAMIQAQKIIMGDFNAFTILVADIMKAYTALMLSVTDCKYMEYWTHFMANFYKIYAIILNHFLELQKDFICVMQSYMTLDLFKMGECFGHFWKVIMTSDSLSH